MKKTFSYRSQEGNILIESIVSISLILIGLLGIFSLVSSSLRQNKNSYLKTDAAYLAAEGIEIVRNIIDTDIVADGIAWNETIGGAEFETFEVDYASDRGTLVSLGGTNSTRPLVRGTETGLFGYNEEGDQTPFFRTVMVSRDEASPDEIKISSIVEWDERGRTRLVNVSTVLTNWRSE
jgi:hypothetical protein